MLRKVIIVLSVILLFFVATMIYVLYGIYDTNSIKLDSNHKELVTLSKNDNQNVVLDEVGVKNTVRVSLYFYNTKEEIDKIIDLLKDKNKILNEML